MPNKTIYVADDDLPLFDRAQKLAGAALSSVIVRALKQFIEFEEAKQQGLDEITVIVNGEGAHLRKRFTGQRLIRWVQPTANGKGTEIMNVYRTAGQRYALHTRIIPNWELSWGDPELVGNPKNWGWGSKFLTFGHDWEAFQEAGDYSLQVFESLDELKANVSDDFAKAIGEAMEGPDIEQLEI